MDPITIAMASFTAIKAGVSAGKEITSLAKDIGSLFEAIDQAKDNHDKKRSSIFSNANEEALDTYVNRKKAEDLENNLREIIISARGYSGWQELVTLRKEVRLRNKKELEDKKKRNAALFEKIVLWGGITLIALFTFGFGLLFLMYYMDKL
jgi:hypothetical protein